MPHVLIDAGTGTSRTVFAFSGAVKCRLEEESPLGLTLIGSPADAADQKALLAFVGSAPPDLPEKLSDARVDRLDDERYRIYSNEGEWEVHARAVHLHRDVRTAFFRAIPPHTAPLWKRLFWRLVLAVAARPLGKRVLARRSR